MPYQTSGRPAEPILLRAGAAKKSTDGLEAQINKGVNLWRRGVRRRMKHARRVRTSGQRKITMRRVCEGFPVTPKLHESDSGQHAAPRKKPAAPAIPASVSEFRL